uniref:Uncharacterized protein n=1 Tax=Suricata suricatta TaxID=37032 RepID=A0A673TS38_SURSU
MFRFRLLSTQKSNKLKPIYDHSFPPPAQPFSWLSLLREGLSIINATGLGNISACFLCAALGRPPLTAVPHPAALNASTDLFLSPPPISDVSLFPNPLQQQFSFCYYNASTNLCNQTASPERPLKAPEGFFFWCNGTLSKNLSNTVDPELLCLPVTLVPQLTILTPAEYLGWNIPSPRKTISKRAIFLPLVAGISLASSLVATGLAGGALGHSLYTTSKLSQQFAMAIEASAESLASLQRQITSLAQVTLQNRRALDLLTAEKGGTCLFLKEECCFYVNESGLVETRVQQLHKLNVELQKQKFSAAADDWWKSSMLSLLMPLIGPLISLLVVIVLGPFIFNRIIGFIKQQIDSLASKPLQIYYHRLDLVNRGLAKPEVENTPTGTA